MFRRNAILLALSAFQPSMTVNTAKLRHLKEFGQEDTSNDASSPDDTLPFSAQDLAEIELRALQADHPDDWRTVSYVGDIALDNQWSAIYVVTGDERLLGRWAARVDAAMYPGNLRTYEVGKAGQYPGYDDAYNHVTLLIVKRASLELERCAFIDLKAKYPVPV